MEICGVFLSEDAIQTEKEFDVPVNMIPIMKLLDCCSEKFFQKCNIRE